MEKVRFTIYDLRFTIFKSKILNLKSSRGFSLVEMLVTISVLTLLMSVTTISFRSGEKNELVRLSARRIGDALKQIETYAQVGVPAYPAAQSFGVHITTSLPQSILLFADINTAALVGHWDGSTADAQGNKDMQIGDAIGIDATRTGDILLDTITVAYILNDGTAVNTTCMKDAGGACVKDASNNYLMSVSSVDIAAKPPSARFVISGGVDFPSNPVGITVKQVIFDVKRKNSTRHKLVTLNPLSGRIDVEY